MKLIIPTRNRPASLSGVLQFIDTFCPRINVVVADGSHEELREDSRRSADFFKNIDIDFRSYPSDLSYCDRMLDVLENEKDDYIMIGADDDFPLVDAFAQGEKFLTEHSDYVLMVGPRVIITWDRPDSASSHLRFVREIDDNTVAQRAGKLFDWDFPLSYSLARREVLIERYRVARQCTLGEMFDLVAGLSDIIQGKVHAVPNLTCIVTRNFVHEYWRAQSLLEFFDDGQNIAKMARDFAEKLAAVDRLDYSRAIRIASDIFARWVGIYFTGIPPYYQPGFAGLSFARDPLICDQLETFERIFECPGELDVRFQEQLRFISLALQRNVTYAQANLRGPVTPIEFTVTPSRSSSCSSAPKSRYSNQSNEGSDYVTFVTRVARRYLLDPLTLRQR